MFHQQFILPNQIFFLIILLCQLRYPIISPAELYFLNYALPRPIIPKNYLIPILKVLPIF